LSREAGHHHNPDNDEDKGQYPDVTYREL
jgi:hypothetical protein